MRKCFSVSLCFTGAARFNYRLLICGLYLNALVSYNLIFERLNVDVIVPFFFLSMHRKKMFSG